MCVGGVTFARVRCSTAPKSNVSGVRCPLAVPFLMKPEIREKNERVAFDEGVNDTKKLGLRSTGNRRGQVKSQTLEIAARDVHLGTIP